MVVSDARVVLDYWTAVASGGAVPVWPDGCRDLIVRIAPTDDTRLILSGLDTAARQVAAPPGTRFVGIRLAPGTRFLWEQAPCSLDQDMHSGHVPHPALARWLAAWPADDADWPNHLYEAIDRLTQTPPEGVAEFIHALQRAPGRMPKLGISERTLRRHIHQATGAPPRYWAKLRRAREAGVRLLGAQEPLASLAVDMGYADQAHLTRDLRQWFGTTPGELRTGRSAGNALLSAPDAFDMPHVRTL